MSRKTYEKIANINGMFNMLEQQIIHIAKIWLILEVNFLRQS